MSADRVSVARSALLGRVAELVGREAALAKHLRGQDGRLEQDFADRVAYTEMDEVLEQLDASAREELTSIRSALARMDAGVWGTCSVCHGDIPDARLAALPFATTCVRCA